MEGALAYCEGSVLNNDSVQLHLSLKRSLWWAQLWY